LEKKSATTRRHGDSAARATTGAASVLIACRLAVRGTLAPSR
jgi:hypothetical protein